MRDKPKEGSSRKGRLRQRLRSLAVACLSLGSLCFGGQMALLGSGLSAAAADTCPNATFRTGPSAHLPDCRAYEQVSPVDKNGTDVPDIGGNEVAPSGDRVTFSTQNAFGDTQQSGFVTHYRSSRTSEGWSTQNISPPIPNESIFLTNNLMSSKLLALSADLSGAIFGTLPDPPTLPGTQPDAQNIYRELSAPGGPFDLVNPPWPNPGHSFGSVQLDGAAADLSHIVLEVSSDEPLTPDTPPLENGETEMYDWSDGAMHLVGVLPGGTAAPHGAGLLGPRRNAMSSDGARIFFMSAESLYVRENNTSTTLIGAGRFWGATPDGTHAFYINGAGLHEYDVDTGQTTDIGPASGVAGFSNDGRFVYFGVDTDFTTGNLYAWHDGTVTPIAANIDNANWSDDMMTKARFSEVSPNGRYLVFRTTQPLMSYDNAGHQEIFRYDAAGSSLECISCDPTGAAATGDAALISAPVAFSPHLPDPSAYQQRHVFDDGRVFFDSPDALTRGDTNAETDAYEWEDGQARLISSGQASTLSTFIDTSPSDDDVFFLTRQSLVGADTDSNIDLYDARVGGGLASQQPVAQAQPCTQETCRPSPAPALSEVTPGSSSFSGPGNESPVHKKCKKHGKCVKKKHHHKRHRVGSHG